jgi:hypothetical protein
MIGMTKQAEMNEFEQRQEGREEGREQERPR